jgi:hypothetical protein
MESIFHVNISRKDGTSWLELGTAFVEQNK